MSQPTPKKTEGSQQQSLPWHPNFRNYERLPDIKVVRTAFFVNLVAVVLALGSLSFVVWREYETATLRRQVAQVEERIPADKAKSTEAVALYKEFQKHSDRIEEIRQFKLRGFSVTPIMVHLASTMPSDVVLTSLDFQEKRIVLRGIIRGSADEATGNAGRYFEKLKADKVLAQTVESVTATNMSKNQQDKQFYIEFILNLKPRA
jgi:Tfp pilus assembly protein PilN